LPWCRRHAKEDQILAEHPYRLERALFGELDRGGGDVPIAPQELAGRASRPDAGERIVFSLRQHRNSRFG
jgi:hypothetical protein